MKLLKVMFNNDLSGLTEQEYKEIKQHLKSVYDIEAVFIHPIKFSNNLVIC